MGKLVKPIAIVLLIFMIAFRPGPSAQVVHNIAAVLGDMADGFGQFVAGIIG